jgi:arginase
MPTPSVIIGLIGAPSSAGAYAPGQERAPVALRDAGLGERLAGCSVTVHDHGDLPLRRWAPDRSSPRAQNVDAVVATVDGVRRAVGRALEAGERVLVLGGDCTVGLGTIAALAADGDRDERVGVVYLDLHADMNVPSSVPDGALDWMGLGHALALEGAVPELAARCRLAPEQVCLLGLDRTQATVWENEQLAALGVPVVPVTALAADATAAARDALAALSEAERIAVHFDVDVIDFVDAPLSENTARNVGVPLATALAALTTLLADPRVTALTITELNPVHAAADSGALERFTEALVDACAAWAGADAWRDQGTTALVRRARSADLPAVGQLLHDFNTEYNDPTPGSAALAQRAGELLAAGDSAVLLAGPGPDAIAVLRFRPAIWTSGLECYLAELYVVPDQRRRGLGLALMEAAMALARDRGADAMDLGTGEDDHAARALYERLGFSRREREPDGPIAYFYEREL